MTLTTTRKRLILVIALVSLAGLAAGLGLAAASPTGVPGPIVGLSSPSHPSETTWYESANPSFVWNPVLANGAAISGYSYVLDRNPSTIPDLTSERVSLDYLSRVAYATGARPTEVRVGDLNGDGKEDFVTANATGNTISVLIGRGDGTFNARVDYAMNTQPWSLQLGDLDRDGDLDVVTGDLSANRASVRLNNGSGVFGALAGYATGRQPECMRIGDVNNDTYLDIVTSNATDNTVSVLRGRGDGTFRAKADFATSVHPTSLDIGDLNADGNQDLIAANTGPSTVSVLLGNGDATFDPKVDYATGNTPFTVIVADVNNDGRLDVETVNNGANSASILLGNGDGTLKAKTDYAVGSSPYALDVRDLNQDGAPDLVTSNNGANTASVLMGNGDGTFAAKTDFATGSGPFWVTLGDFNNDGYGDLVSTDYANGANTASVRLGTAYLAVGFTGKADGVWYFHVRALDSYGDGGQTSHRMVRIDTQTATTTQTGADDLWHDGDVTMTLGAADDGTGVAGTEYRVDGGDWISGTTVTIPATPDGSNDGVHVVQYRSTDNFGHVEEIKTSNVKIVTQAPTTTVSGADGAWHDSDVTLSFASASAGDPVVEYQIDGGPWVTGNSATIPASPDGSNDGEHAIRYRSTNALGMVETAQSAIVKIDVAAPTTTLSGGDSAWHNSDVTLGFSGSDAGSGVAKTEYRIDGGAWVEGSSATVPAPADGSNDGSHTVEYRSTDTSGHVEAANSATVKIDAGAPTTSATGADDLWHDADVSVTLSGSDAGSGVAKTEYRIDGGAWVEGTSILIAAPGDGSNDGAHTVEYRSTDDAGNVESAQSVVVKVVTVAPTTSAAGGDNAWHDSDVTLTFSTSGAGVAKTEYRIDGGAWVEGSSATVPAPADGSNDGTHTVEYRSTNALGLIESEKSSTVKIDTGDPATTVSGADDLWHDADVSVTLSGSDAGSGVAKTEYRIDGGAWVEGTSILIAAPGDGSNDGAHTVEYRSTDDAGNVESAQSVIVKIDVAAPTTTTPETGAWHSAPYTLELVPTDAGSGMTGGLAKTEYSTDDGATWLTGTELQFRAWKRTGGSGEFTVLYRSTDAAGYVEAEKSVVVKIDTEHPRTRDDAPTGPQATDVTVTFTGRDDYSGIAETWYSVDGGTWTVGSSVTVSAASAGDHWIAYYSIDNAGNVEVGYRVAQVVIAP